MITYEQAKKIAFNELKKMEESSLNNINEEPLRLHLFEEFTIEEDFGWVFFYDTKELVETGDISHAMGGNAPFIVTRKEGTVHYTGTAKDTKFYIEEFKKKYYS
jgi:hypothetical protein